MIKMYALRKSQRGAVLIVSLLFLIVLTVLGLASVRSTTMQERMAFNSREQNLAFQAAEAAMQEAELWLENQRGSGSAPVAQSGCTSNCFSVPVWTSANPGGVASLVGQTHAWWANIGRQHGQALDGTDTDDLDSDLHAAQPYFIIQEVNIAAQASDEPESLVWKPSGALPGPFVYLISAYGVGKTSYVEGATTRHFDVLLQSVYQIKSFD